MKQIRLIKCKFEETDSLTSILDFEKFIFPKILELSEATEGGYPLIQFKWREQRREFLPLILCIEEGIERAFPIFDSLNNSPYLNFRDIVVYKRVVQIWQEMFCYELKNWQPIAHMSYADFLQSFDFQYDKVKLSEILLQDIQNFLNAVSFERCMETNIVIKKIAHASWSNEQLQISLLFEANVSLPDFVGLGYGAERGMGVVLSRQKSNLEKIFPKMSSKPMI